MKIVHVDNKQIVHEYTLDYLHDLIDDFEYVDFTCPKKAIEYMQKSNDVSILLTDNNMPEINGFDVAANVRFNGFDGTIVMLSSNGKNIATKNNVGINHFIDKMDIEIGLKEILQQQIDRN